MNIKNASLAIIAVLFAWPAFAQAPPQNQPPPGYPQNQGAPPPYQGDAQQGPPPGYQGPPPPSFSPQRLDQLVSRIALYPDSLLAQILAAATYPDQIPDAARWADEHHYLAGQALADAIQADQLPWDPSVQALLPFPSVLGMMAGDMGWTTDIGNAFLAQQQDVMDAVQAERHKAAQYGYLRSNDQVMVGMGPYITISPANPGYVVVPAYDPAVVFYAPRPGFFIGGGIHWGFGITIGGFFRPWGWGYERFDWGRHTVFLNNSPWRRGWYNRGVYVHPYGGFHRYGGPGYVRPAEHHEVHDESPRERGYAREGRRGPEEHHGEGHDRR